MARMGRPPENDYRKLIIMAEIKLENGWMTLTAIARVVFEQSSDEHSEEGAIKRLTRKFKVHGAKLMAELRGKEEKPTRSYYRVPSSSLWMLKHRIDLSTLGIAHSVKLAGMKPFGGLTDEAMSLGLKKWSTENSLFAAASQLNKQSLMMKKAVGHLTIPRSLEFGASSSVIEASRLLTERQKSMADALSVVQPRSIKALAGIEAIAKHGAALSAVKASILPY